MAVSSAQIVLTQNITRETIKEEKKKDHDKILTHSIVDGTLRI